MQRGSIHTNRDKKTSRYHSLGAIRGPIRDHCGLSGLVGVPRLLWGGASRTLEVCGPAAFRQCEARTEGLCPNMHCRELHSYQCHFEVYGAIALWSHNPHY